MLSKQVRIEQTNASACMSFTPSASHSHVTIRSGCSTSPSSQFMDTNFGTHRRNSSISDTLFLSLSLPLSSSSFSCHVATPNQATGIRRVPSTLLLHSHSISASCPSIYLVTQIVIISGVTVVARCRLLFQGRNPVENIFGLNIYFESLNSQIFS